MTTPSLTTETATPADLLNQDFTVDTIETRLWLEEHDWLYQILKSDKNVSPTFRFPDLISACISLVFETQDAANRIFEFLGAELILRSPLCVRRRESLWRPQYELLLALQRSPANRHPNPKFQLDQLTTACVALVNIEGFGHDRILQQARLNMSERAALRRNSVIPQ